MITRITNKNEMKYLYDKKLISKTTYYRGLKRGYVILNYHKIKNLRESINPNLFWQQYKQLEYSYREIIYKLLKELKIEMKEEKIIELMEEGIKYLFAKKIYPEDGKNYFRLYCRDILRNKRSAHLYRYYTLN